MTKFKNKGKKPKNANSSYLQTDSRLVYLYQLSKFAPTYGKRLIALSNKSQRRLTAAVKRRICECGRRLNEWTVEEKLVRSICESCSKERVLDRYLKNPERDLLEELQQEYDIPVVREKNKRNFVPQKQQKLREQKISVQKGTQVSKPHKRKKRIKGVNRKPPPVAGAQNT